MRKFLAAFLCILALSPAARADEGERYVALTFDDGPSGRFTRRLLEGLEERDAKATFLLCGYRLKQYPELAQQMMDQGHELGIHGYSHRDMRGLSRRDIGKEIMDTEALMPEGCRITFLRPPGGAITDAVRQVARARNYALLGWSVDPLDWKIRDTGTICASVTECVRDGDIILLHDMSDSSVDAALAIIDRLQKADFTFVTVSELMRIRDIQPVPGQEYKRLEPKE